MNIAFRNWCTKSQMGKNKESWYSEFLLAPRRVLQWRRCRRLSDSCRNYITEEDMKKEDDNAKTT